MTYDREREHFRIIYPAKARPRLTVQGRSYEVLDLSEGGLRIALTAEAPPAAAGEELSGVLRFKRDEEIVLVRGTVIRVGPDHLAIRLEVGLGFKVVLAEQRFLLEQHYGLTW